MPALIQTSWHKMAELTVMFLPLLNVVFNERDYDLSSTFLYVSPFHSCWWAVVLSVCFPYLGCYPLQNHVSYFAVLCISESHLGRNCIDSSPVVGGGGGGGGAGKG